MTTVRMSGATRIGALVTIGLLLTACAVQRSPETMRVPEAKEMPDETQPAVPEPEIEVPAPPPVDPMADVRGDRPLPAARGKLERYDCMIGVEDEHARMAFEARGGQVTGFSYYSKWKPRTCSIDVRRADPRVKWRLTPEGATRVHTPIGMYIIRTTREAYVFEFLEIQRMPVCGMMGTISGTMTVKRLPARPVCSLTGVMER